jgi:hypothetical protein
LEGQTETADAGSLLVEELLNLLTTFIGGSLTRRLVRRVWKDLEDGLEIREDL